MRTKISFLMAVLLSGIMVANAQGGFQRRTVEERVAIVHAKMDSAFKPNATKLAALDSVFSAYYRAQDQKRQEMMSGGAMPDRETMMAEMRKLADPRDEKLKGILSESEFKTWKDAIEPSLRPQRPGGGGGNNR
jgi:hypothetical protein